MKKIRLVHLQDLFEGRGEKGWCDLVCGVPLDDWANGGYLDVLFTCGECSFSSFGIWSTHSKFPALFSFRNSARNIQKDYIFLKFSLLTRLLWRQFSSVRCNVCITYLNVQIFVCITWFRHVLVHACAITRVSGQRLIIVMIMVTPR